MSHQNDRVTTPGTTSLHQYWAPTALSYYNLGVEVVDEDNIGVSVPEWYRSGMRTK
jgi:hypothetical protein